MRTYIRLIRISMLAAIVLSLGAGAASALRSISLGGLEAGGAVRFAGRIRFHKSGEARNSITCSITILRTISKIIPKIAGTRIGRVTGFAVDVGERGLGEHCTSTAGAEGFRQPLDIIPLQAAGTAGVARELPGGILLYDLRGAAAELWVLIYDGFRGTLPTITNIDFHIEKAQLQFKFEREGTTFPCLAQGRLYLTLLAPAREAREGRGEAVTERTRIGVEEEERSRNCFALLPVTWEGNFVVTPVIPFTLL